MAGGGAEKPRWWQRRRLYIYVSSARTTARQQRNMFVCQTNCCRNPSNIVLTCIGRGGMFCTLCNQRGQARVGPPAPDNWP